MTMVFLSSTGRDLSEHREAVFQAISRLDGYSCKRMEVFGARVLPPLETCLGQLVKCDVFVGLVGHYHGSSPPNDEKSFTEHEYHAASNLDRLMFLAPQDFPVAAHLREPENKWQRQQDFQGRIRTECVVDKITSPDELATRVVTALSNWERTRPKLSITLAPGEYTVIVKSPSACETYKVQVNGKWGGALRPNSGERHVLWAVFVATEEPAPIILDFRKGTLPEEVKFYRASAATYKPRQGESWVTACLDEPRFEELSNGVKALVLEPHRTNLYLDSSNPKSGGVHLSQGYYTIWMEGAGYLEVSHAVIGEPSLKKIGMVQEGRPLIFHQDQSGSCFVTVIGEVERLQLEKGDYPTSYIETTAIPTTRIADGVSSLESIEPNFELLRSKSV